MNIYTNLKKKNTNDVIYPNISPSQNIPNNSIENTKLNFHLYNLHIKIGAYTTSDNYRCSMSITLTHTATTISLADLKTYLSTHGYTAISTAYSCCGKIEYQNFESLVNGISVANNKLYASVLDYVGELVKNEEIDETSITYNVDSVQLF